MPLGRGEPTKQAGELGFRFEKCDFGKPALPPAKGVKDQQRLVRGSLVPLSPNGEVVELGQDGSGVHGWPPCSQTTEGESAPAT